MAAPAGADDLAAWRERDPVRAHVARLPDPDLERLFLRCESESSERMMDFSEAALCSISLETLKQRRFGGDFNALLAWWRLQREERAQTSSVPARRR